MIDIECDDHYAKMQTELFWQNIKYMNYRYILPLIYNSSKIIAFLHAAHDNVPIKCLPICILVQVKVHTLSKLDIVRTNMMISLQNAMPKIMCTQPCESTSRNVGVSHSEVIKADIVTPFFYQMYHRKTYLTYSWGNKCWINLYRWHTSVIFHFLAFYL